MPTVKTRVLELFCLEENALPFVEPERPRPAVVVSIVSDGGNHTLDVAISEHPPGERQTLPVVFYLPQLSEGSWVGVLPDCGMDLEVALTANAMQSPSRNKVLKRERRKRCGGFWFDSSLREIAAVLICS